MTTFSRVPVVRGVLGVVERVHLFLKYTEHSYMVLVAIVIGLLGSLGALDIRKRFGVSLLLIKRKGDDGEDIVDEFPDAESVFQEGDVMLVLGSEDRIGRFERRG